MYNKWIAILILLILTALPVSAQGRELPTDLCGTADVVTDIEASVLADIQAIHSGNPYILINRSPQCRYVIAMFQVATDPEFERLFVMWDMNTGGRLFEFARRRTGDREVPFFRWNAELSEVVVGGWSNRGFLHDGTVRPPMNLLKLSTFEHVELDCDIRATTCVVPDSRDIYWDDDRNWLFMAGSNGVVAFDRNSGQVARLLLNLPWTLYGRYLNKYFLSDDEAFAVIYVTSGTVDYLTVWDINSYQSYPVHVDGFVPLSRCRDRSTTSVDLSPDNRYLAIGFRAIRVWDLQNLEPAYEDRFPIYRHEGPFANIGCLQFIDNATIETRSADGVQLWNLHTGELIESDSP